MKQSVKPRRPFRGLLFSYIMEIKCVERVNWMDIKSICEDWKMREKNKQASLDMWNSMAPHFGEFTLPTSADNEFMSLLEREKMVSKDSEVLDVGCGAGRFALALAGQCRHVTGMDLSPKMIALAKEKADAYQVENADFFVNDWHTFDLKAAGFVQKFDLVFAHMSPAIQSADTFMKLSEASKGWCAMVKPVRRQDPISDHIRELLDIEEKQGSDDDFLYALSILWCQGYLPHLAYERKQWNPIKTMEESYSLYINRFKTSHDLTEAQEAEIRKYLQSIAKDGQVQENVDTLTATIYWQVTKGD